MTTLKSPFTKPWGIFICALFVVSALGMLTDVILPDGEETALEPEPNRSEAVAAEPASPEETTSTAQSDPATADIPVDSPTVYPAGVSPIADSVCQAALKQYLTYVEARAAYLLRAAGTRTHETETTIAQYLTTRDQAVTGELAILAAKSGTFQGNPDHFNTLTTLAAERQAVALATHWHTADSLQQPRAEVKTYDVNLQC